MQDREQQAEELKIQQNQQNQQDQIEQQQITPETIQSFNKVCQDAALLMNAYKQQSIALKQEISDMVTIYQKSSSETNNSIPVQKIIQITKQYEIGMRQANSEYNSLTEELRKEEKERDQMMRQIQSMFSKLENMEVKLKEKKLKNVQKTQSNLKDVQNNKIQKQLSNLSINQKK